ncbi:MAG: peptidylprolyl isomerase, partial [Actinomycetota bacterium]|nr:peptidylprolyl isomerase [Actinomycetota bacterium]
QQPFPTADLVADSSAATTTSTDAAGSDPVAAGSGASDSGSSECANVEAPETREDGGATQPTETLDPALTWTLTFETSCGEFVVTLDLESAPDTTASLVALAESGFYDDTVFHRIIPGFVVQGGDPTASGEGGPGYQTVDPPAADATYVHGVVAMAKSPQEAAGTSGSQFFVVTGDDAGLPPDYAIVGDVTEGLDVVDLIGTLGDPATEAPTQVVLIESVTVESAP